MSSTQQMTNRKLSQAVSEAVTYLSSKYGFAEKEAQEEVSREVLSKYLEEKEKKIGRPEKKKMENAPSAENKEEAAFIAEVENASEAKVEYKKIEKKKKGKSASVVEVTAPLLSQVEEVKEVLMSDAEKQSVDAKIAEVMRAQMEKYKTQLVSKVEKKSSKEVSAVVVEEVVSPLVVPPLVVQEVVVEEKKKLLKKKPAAKAVVAAPEVTQVVDMKSVDEKIAEVMKAQADRMKEKQSAIAVSSEDKETASESVSEVKKVKKVKKVEEKKSDPVVPPEVTPVVDMKSVDEKIAEVMKAQAEKLKEKMKEKATVAVVPEEKVVEKKVKKSKPVVEKSVLAVVVEKKVEAVVVEEVAVAVEQTVLFRHNEKIYKKSKVGILYDRHSEVRVGKVDESGKVTLDAQEVEEELCSEEESGSEDEYESDA